jgi:hypothetical protein
MNVQYLASALGLTLTTAYTTGGVIGGGGTDYAISGAYNTADFGSGNDPGNGGLTNSFFQGSAQGNAAVLSTVQQLQAYLNSVHGVADPSAVYLISSGANDTAYARTTLQNNPVAQQAYLTRQAQALATEIEALFDAGARHIVVNDVIHNDNISLLDYSKVLYADLNAAGIPYIKSDVHEMTQTVLANPTNYGFTSQTVSVNDPALIEPDPGPDPDPPDDDQNAWGLWAANTTTPQGGNVPLVDQYSYLKPPDNPQQPQISTEETHFFTDNEHLSDAGQRIQGNFDYNLISDDAIDLTNLTYSPATTTVSFSGTTTGGTLTVSNGAQSANISLLGNYLAAAFVTASDGNIGASGNTGTLVMDTTGSQQQILLAHAPH